MIGITRSKLFKIRMLIFWKLRNLFSYDSKEYRNGTLYFLSKKYKKFLKTLPIYKETGLASNKVWLCWLQGEDEMPKLCRKCLISVRKYLKNREIIVITKENLDEYLELPAHIMKKYKAGIISNTHMSDIIRVSLLSKFGGTWIDASVLLTGYDASLYDQKLFVFQNWMKSEDEPLILSSWFITSEIGHPILRTTQDLLYRYWEDFDYECEYFIFHYLFRMAADKYPRLWRDVHRFSNVPPHILQFELDSAYSEKRWDEICRMSTVHKLSQKIVFSNGKNRMIDFILGEGDNVDKR